MRGIFISYGRKDDEPFAAQLYADLARQGIALWRDQEAMRSRGRGLVQQIQDGIADFDRLLLIVGPYALDSAYCRMEWEFALETCRIVIPIFRKAGAEALPPSLRMLHGYDFSHHERYAASLDTLLADLREDVPALARLHDVDPLPPFFLPRPAELADLSDALVRSSPAPEAGPGSRITVLHGMPGCGKSSLAAAFARSCSVRRAFNGGIYWVSLGQNAEVRRALLGDPGEAPVGGRLVVLDDVWEKGQVEPLLKVLQARDRLLLTTRRADLATLLGAQPRLLDTLDDEAALELLARWSKTPVDRLDATAVEVARECGNLPLSLAMLGALVSRGSVSWHAVLKQLREADLAGLEQELQNYPHASLLRAMQVSVNALRSAAERDRYLALAVFAEGHAFVPSVLALLWGIEDADDAQVSRQVDELVSRSLLRKDAAGMLSLHDLHHDYLRAVAGKSLAALHSKLLDAYRDRHGADWLESVDDGYMPDRLTYHLAAAGRRDELKALFDRELPGPRSAWAQMRAMRDPSGAAFRSDIAHWWRMIERDNRRALVAGDEAGELAVELRCALTASTLTAHAAQLTPKLLAALASAGVWSIDAAEAAAWQMPQEDAIASALEAIAPLLDAKAITKAFRWYFHEPQTTFSSFVLTALAKRLAELGEVQRAATLARQARAKVRDECQERVVRALLDCGNPVGALEALLSSDQPHRFGMLCWDLARQLPPGALVRLQSVTSLIADDPPATYRSCYRSWIEATLTQRYLELGQPTLAEQSFAAIADDLLDVRAKCVRDCAALAPPAWVTDTLAEALAGGSIETWQTLAALKALVQPAFALGLQAPLVAAVQDRKRVQNWTDELPARTAELLLAVGVRLAGAPGEHLRSSAAALMAHVSDPKDRAACLREFAADCAEPERSACLRAAHAELTHIADPGERLKQLLWSLDKLGSEDQEDAVFELATLIEALEDDAESHSQAEQLCNWSAAHGQATQATELAERLDRPAGRLRFRLLRAIAAFVPVDRLDALIAAGHNLNEEYERSIVATAVAERFLKEARVRDALALLSDLAEEQRHVAYVRLLPQLPRARARQLAADLLQKRRLIGDASPMSSMQGAIARALAQRGQLTAAMQALDSIANEAIWFDTVGTLAHDAGPADLARLREIAEPVGNRLSGEADNPFITIALTWSELGCVERALGAVEQVEVDMRREHQRELLVRYPHSTLDFAQALALTQQIANEQRRLEAYVALWARHPGQRDATAAAIRSRERWASLWEVDDGRLMLAATAVSGSWNFDLDALRAKLSCARHDFVTGLSDIERTDETRLALLEPHVDQALAGDAIVALLEDAPFPPKPIPNQDTLLAWFCKRLSASACAEVLARLRTHPLPEDEDDGMDCLARAQVIGVLAMHGPIEDPAPYVEDVIAYAAEVDDEFWATEPLHRVYPLLPAHMRARLSARASYFLIEALRTEDDLDVSQFAAHRLAPALLGLDPPALHQAWADLLHALSTRERTVFWRFETLLIEMAGKLGGEAALSECARELQRLQRLWP